MLLLLMIATSTAINWWKELLGQSRAKWEMKSESQNVLADDERSFLDNQERIEKWKAKVEMMFLLMMKWASWTIKSEIMRNEKRKSKCSSCWWTKELLGQSRAKWEMKSEKRKSKCSSCWWWMELEEQPNEESESEIQMKQKERIQRIVLPSKERTNNQTMNERSQEVEGRMVSEEQWKGSWRM